MRINWKNIFSEEELRKIDEKYKIYTSAIRKSGKTETRKILKHKAGNIKEARKKKKKDIRKITYSIHHFYKCPQCGYTRDFIKNYDDHFCPYDGKFLIFHEIKKEIVIQDIRFKKQPQKCWLCTKPALLEIDVSTGIGKKQICRDHYRRLTDKTPWKISKHIAGKIIRSILYELIKSKNEVLNTNQIYRYLMRIEVDVPEISSGINNKIKAKDLFGIWRGNLERPEKSISRLLSYDKRFSKIDENIFGLKGWSSDKLVNEYVKLASEYRVINPKKKERFLDKAISLLESGKTKYPDKDTLIRTLRRL